MKCACDDRSNVIGFMCEYSSDVISIAIRSSKELLHNRERYKTDNAIL